MKHGIMRGLLLAGESTVANTFYFFNVVKSNGYTKNLWPIPWYIFFSFAQVKCFQNFDKAVDDRNRCLTYDSVKRVHAILNGYISSFKHESLQKYCNGFTGI